MTQEELDEYYKANNIEIKKKEDKIKDAYSDYGNWLVIAAMVFVQIGMSVLKSIDTNIRNAFPTTDIEWIIWISIKTISAIVSFIIFNSFVKEGEKRGKQTSEYKAAQERFFKLFDKEISKDIKTLSPRQYLAQTRGKKAIKIVATSALSGIAISLATIQTDWSSLIGIFVSILMTFVWGYQKMLDVQEYFTNGYMQYVIVEEHKIKLKETIENGNQNRGENL